MKRLIIILSIILCICTLTACSSTGGDTLDVKIEIGKFTKFTQQEIEQAVDVVKGKFQSFENCKLNSLQYDEEKSNAQVEFYLDNGGGSVNGATAENTIVLFSEFYVNSKASGAWEPDSDYSWMFILIRDNKDTSWVVDDMGY